MTHLFLSRKNRSGVGTAPIDPKGNGEETPLEKLINTNGLPTIMMGFMRRVVKWMICTKVLKLPRDLLGRLVTYIISNKHGVIMYYNQPDRTEILDLIRKIKRETEMLLGDNEAYQIFMAVKRTEKIRGSVAEVGVYKGGSAKIICEAKGNRQLYLFDTFRGLPKPGKNDTSLERGQFCASLSQAKDYLKGYSNILFYEGLFPHTAEPVRDRTFSFVHIDVDTYESTLSCLNFFYDRMGKGGIIISHDYSSLAGVRKALDGFLEDKPEPIIDLPGSQCLIVKI